MERLGEGRMAEVFAVDHRTVVKLDRPEFQGVAAFEAAIILQVARSGAPVPEMIGTTVVDGRSGVLLERIHGPRLAELIRCSESVEPLADAFVELHIRLHEAHAPSAPDLVARLAHEVDRSPLPPRTRAELTRHVDEAAGDVGLCHFDLHPDNVIVGETGWKVIDWVSAARGPTVADFARTILLRADATDRGTAAFLNRVRYSGSRRRGIGSGELRTWVRVAAAARLSEGFGGSYAGWLRSVALDGL